jgi:monooxygenase
LDFTPGYVLRVIDQLPRMGSKKPWKLKQNYFYDKSMLKNVDLDDGVLEFK